MFVIKLAISCAGRCSYGPRAMGVPIVERLDAVLLFVEASFMQTRHLDQTVCQFESLPYCFIQDS